MRPGAVVVLETHWDYSEPLAVVVVPTSMAEDEVKQLLHHESNKFGGYNVHFEFVKVYEPTSRDNFRSRLTSIRETYCKEQMSEARRQEYLVKREYLQSAFDNGVLTEDEFQRKSSELDKSYDIG